MPLAITLHILSAVIWIGGMFFAYVALRPVAAALLEPPLRLSLWSQTFSLFFRWVWVAIILLPTTGYWMILKVFDGFTNIKLYIDIMQVIGIMMILIYLYVFFVPYRRMKVALSAGTIPAAGKQLAVIRKLIGTNLILGLITIIVAAGGAYWE